MIIVRLAGGMGNQLFQYALGRALSLHHKVPLKLDITFLENQTAIPFIRKGFVARPYVLDLFAIEAGIAQKNDIPWYGRPFFSGFVMQGIDALLRKIPVLPGWEKKFQFDSRVLSLGPDAYLAGFWQSEQYFSNIADTIRHDLVLKHSLPESTENLRHDIQNCTSVCIHIRRSDIASKSFHGAIDTLYYDRGITYIAQTCTIDRLYVFSDDIAWSKEHFAFDIETVFVGPEHAGDRDGGHLALMAACTHFVIANSTFSWWAAWLGDYQAKIVIAPKKWFTHATIDTTDLIPEEWVLL